VNAGVRFDYIDANAPSLKSEDLPLGPDLKLTDDDLADAKSYSRVSPRIGVGFPVTDRTVLHVNWGQFYQQPNLQDLYVSYRFLEYKIQNGGYFVPFGNPNLRPEQTTAYEVGFAHAFNDVAKMDVSAYYKDVRDLVQVQNVPSKPYNFSSFRNKDFATIKGVDIGFTMRRVNHVSANVYYSLSFAKGTGSVSLTQSNIAWTASEPPRQTSPLDFDQRHKLSVNLDYALAKGEGMAIGTWHPFQNFNINVLYNVASGTPFTPIEVMDEVTLAAVSTRPEGALNSRFGPWTQSLDFKAKRGIGLSGLNLDAYVWVLNLFDTNNAVNVYGGTGSAYNDGYLSTPPGQSTAADLAAHGIDPVAAYNLALQGAGLFSTPRTVRFGVQLGF
jgi:outer membrane receptor protein involved in Fe transport